MFKNQHSFLTGIIVLYITITLILGGLLIHKYNINDKLSIGDIFIDSRLTNYLINLIYLDDFHSKFVLKKGLPIVRVQNDNLVAQSKKNNSIVDFTFSFITDLPLSFFEVKDKDRIQPVISRWRIKNDANLEEKLKAEGTHKDERVELDFWQTEPSLDQNRIRNGKTESNNRLPDLPKKNDRKRFKTPVVGIYHTHTAENYGDRGYNARAKPGTRGDVVLIGDELKKQLEDKYNIPVIHSRKVHDKTYSKSYINSLYTGKTIVKNNPNLQMIFDIHRDAIGKGGRNLITTTINGQKVARIMIIVTNNNYLPNPHWQENVNFAKRLAKKMNSMYPGLLRDVKLLSNRRYNQHIHPHALLLEIGGAKNTIPEAKRSADLLANVLASLIK